MAPLSNPQDVAVWVSERVRPVLASMVTESVAAQPVMMSAHTVSKVFFIVTPFIPIFNCPIYRQILDNILRCQMTFMFTRL